jgi:plastocyanin
VWFARALTIVGLMAGAGTGTVRALAAASVTAQVRYERAGHGQDSDNSNIVVWLKPLSAPQAERAEAKWRSLPRRYQLVQHHKRFTPHLLVVPAGAAVDFPNRDPFFHNVFSLFDGKRFDLGLYEAGATRTVKFDHAGVSFIFCNIHPEMSAVVVALETPYFGVSSRSGEVTIAGVAPGRYQLEVWAERALPESLKELGREVDITDNEAVSLGEIRLQEAGDLLAHHKNLYGRDYDTTTSPGGPYQP